MFTRKKIWLAFLSIFILAIFCGLIDWPRLPGDNFVFNWFSKPKIHLGLDLQGGTHLVYQADISKIPSKDRVSALDGVRDVIERRVNVFGVSEPVIQTNKVGSDWRVIVELPGIKDVSEAIKMIGETPLLEFKEKNNEPEEGQKQRVRDEAQEALKGIKIEPDKFTEIANQIAEKENIEYKENDYQFKDEINYSIQELVWSMRIGETSKDLIEGDNGFIFQEGQIVPRKGYYLLKMEDKKKDVDREIKHEKEVQASHILIAYEGAEKSQAARTKKEAKDLAENLLKRIKEEGADFAALAKENSDDNSAEQGGDLGFFKKGQMVPAFSEVAFSMGKEQISDIVETEFGYHIIKVTDIKEESTEKKIEDQIKFTSLFFEITFDPWKNTGLSGTQLKGSAIEFEQTTNEPKVLLEFNDEGKKLFGEITKRNIGQPVAIFLDGQPISIPTVQEEISGGKAVITGKFSMEEAKTLAQRLQAGALPVPINLISQQNIGPSLGKISLQKSLMAGLWGLILVALFMILYYRLPGLMSVFALCLYGGISIALFKLIPVTLSLAGIAGFILSIGMAVDANVLIFERMKEERRIGKPLAEAIDEGFKRAWPSIRDGNVTTLITCFILFYFGTSMVRGFGLTLGIGILVSMFSAIVVTRILMKIISNWPIKKSAWIWGRR